MIPLKMDMGPKSLLSSENEILQHIKEYPDEHHHTPDELMRCCLVAHWPIYEGYPTYSGLVLSEPALRAHFSNVYDNENCTVTLCFCSLKKEEDKKEGDSH